MKRLLAGLLCLCLMPLSAMAQMVWVDLIPTPGPGQEMTAQEILDSLRATPTPPAPETFDLLIIGTDHYTDPAQGRSDAMVLARLDAATGRVRLISFLRDLYVKIPGKGSSRLNAAYAWGGPELLIKTLEQNFGVTCDAYVAVNFSLMADLIDGIGGVEVDLTQQEMRQVNAILEYYNRQTGYKAAYQRLETWGRVLLTGRQAMSFSRIRKIDSDFQRVNRQQAVLEAIFHKLAGMDALTLGALAAANIHRVRTNLSLEDAMTLFPTLMRARGATFEHLRIPAQGAYSSQTRSGMAVLVPDLNKSRRLIDDFFRGE